ncbi:hypothetical protein L1279_003505 [Planomicrobium sp. HSC-17F08]|nr:hypothetical protein [Planomicrobium sp. HSC-17F08]
MTLAADHVDGLDGAAATIDFAEATSVYRIDFMPTAGEDPVTIHNRIIENGFSAE